MIKVETIIAGGGPAGSSCAGELINAGHDVLILDKNESPGLKPCAGWITPAVFRSLHTTPASYPHQIRPVNKMIFSIFGKKIPLRTRQYGIRRIEFDDWLLKRSKAPVQRHVVKTIRVENGEYIIDDTYRCKYLVGAGGTHCPVYRHFFSEIHTRNPAGRIIAMEEEFFYDYSNDSCYLWFMENGLPGYSWYFPKGNGIVNIGIGAKHEVLRSRNENIHLHWERLTRKLRESGLITGHDYHPRGYTYYIRQKISTPRTGNALIAGDAAALATRDMGEGIGPALRSGILAARSIIDNAPYRLNTVNTYSLPGLIFPGRKP